MDTCRRQEKKAPGGKASPGLFNIILYYGNYSAATKFKPISNFVVFASTSGSCSKTGSIKAAISLSEGIKPLTKGNKVAN